MYDILNLLHDNKHTAYKVITLQSQGICTWQYSTLKIRHFISQQIVDKSTDLLKQIIFMHACIYVLKKS